MTYLLEYNPEHKIWHNNYYLDKAQRLQNKVCTNGWLPVVVLDDDMEDSLFDKLLLEYSGKPYEEIVSIFSAWACKALDKKFNNV